MSLCLMFEFGVVVGLMLGLVSLVWIGGCGAESWFEVAVVWWRFVNLIFEVCEFDGGGYSFSDLYKFCLCYIT
jgi:hypothetical protein